MRLGLLLALVGYAMAHQCNVGNLLVQNGAVTYRATHMAACEGLCTRQVLTTSDRQIVLMGCEENEIASYKSKHELPTCDSEKLEACACETQACNEVNLPVKINDDLLPNEDAATNILCYVGYWGSNNYSVGDVTYCGSNSICAMIHANLTNVMAVEAYFCTPLAACTSLGVAADSCGTVGNETGVVSGCCCTKQDCTTLVTNPMIPPLPANKTVDTTSINCYYGAQLNYSPLGALTVGSCLGNCASASISTTFGGAKYVLDLFTCDPSELCGAIGLSNKCSSLDGTPTISYLRGCCCNSNNCINPTTTPPTYPVPQLTCYTGIYVPTTNYSIGAQMACSGQCGRIEVPINGVIYKYMDCAPYSMCYGLGISGKDSCTNPPLEEEVTACCCSGSNNCNIAAVDQPFINATAVISPNTVYPILCYGGLYLNNVSMGGSYSQCSGECAVAYFQTTVYGQQHNATLYTCDPVTMCRQAGISNGCGQIAGGVTACCCGQDHCFDPNRAQRPNRTCYTGLYVAQDNYLSGGEMLCDGWCATLSTSVNSKNVTTFWCAPIRTCRAYALGLTGNYSCNSITGTSGWVQGCCCSDTDNCNAKAVLPPTMMSNITAIKARIDPPIVCYEGLWINGQVSGNDQYRVCDGECVSIFMAYNATNTATLYTCDSSASCGAQGLNNNCSTIDGTVTTCCCDSDACIDPYKGRTTPGQPQYCYVGVTAANLNISTGARVLCNGKCGSMTSHVNGYPFQSFHCLPSSICSGLYLDNSCNTLVLDRAITGCCCDNSDMCNLANTNINGSAVATVAVESPIACYQGIEVNGQFSAGSGFGACFGDCFSVQINTTLNGANYAGTVYTCDPTTVCRALNVTNRCHLLEAGVDVCCCNTDACIDPTVIPHKKPRRRPLTCWAGIYSTYGVNSGAEIHCLGDCASINSVVAGYNVTVFQCSPPNVCKSLGLYDQQNNGCQTLLGDRAYTGCCCDDYDNCNAKGYPVPANSTAPRNHDYPISCYQGIYLNGQPFIQGSYQACLGDCAVIQVNTTYQNMAQNLQLFTCDPSTVCQQLNLTNACSTVANETGLIGCCCNTDICIDPRNNKYPGKQLMCYVGVKSTTGINVGAEVQCNGKCGALTASNVAGQNVTAYMCAPTSICRSLELNNVWKPLPGDTGVKGFCCDATNNCNTLGDPTINTTRTLPPKEFPITCYSGIFVNGQAVTSTGFMACNGDCVAMTLNTTNGGVPVSATMYTCDPSSVCRGLGMMNNCTTLAGGFGGCCCNTDACIDPTKSPMKLPGNPLYCYVGVQSSFAGVTAGAQVACNGKCASLNTMVNQYNVTTYHCVPTQVCQTLELDDSCNTLITDRAITACCCDNSNNCNVKNTSIVVPSPNANTEYPIACWTGVYVNGSAITAASYQTCQGQCASLTLSTMYMKQNVSATLYGCDPSSVCNQLNATNTCTSPEPGLQACCCNTDACINPIKNRNPGNNLQCYVGVYVGATNFSQGASVSCSGRCGSLSTYVGCANNATSQQCLVKSYHCVSTATCATLQLDDSCGKIQTDQEITGCCCDNANNCNVQETGITPMPLNNTSAQPPIACYSALVVNNATIGNAQWLGCNGQCAAVQYTTTYQSKQHVLTFYTCDPVAVCTGIGLTNTCAQVANSSTLKGCCCNYDACISPSSLYPTPGPTQAASGTYSLFALIVSIVYFTLRQ